MLAITATPNQAGVKISGDYFDLDELNQALYKILGPEGKYFGYEGSRTRVLAVAYEIRLASQGERNLSLVFNGLNDSVKKQKNFIGPDKNLYFSAEVLWPEIIYAAIALKDFVRLYAGDAPQLLLDPYVPVVSRFQALVFDCLHGHVPEDQFSMILQAFQAAPGVNDYAVQYVDFLNLRYLDMSKAEREKSLAAIAIKLAVHDQDYEAFRKQVLAAAEPVKRSIHEIPVSAEYPEQIDW